MCRKALYLVVRRFLLLYEIHIAAAMSGARKRPLMDYYKCEGSRSLPMKLSSRSREPCNN